MVNVFYINGECIVFPIDGACIFYFKIKELVD